LLVWQAINFIQIINNLYILILVFFELKIVFEISILNKKIKSNIIKDSLNIVINTILLVLNFKR